jgi:iduronate 2-sulfatase
VESIDIFPTLMDLCHLPKPVKLDGISLLPVLKTPNTLIKNFAITQHPRPAYYDREPDNKPKVMGYSLRSADFRFTEWRNWENGNIIATELYDHRTDPKETKNLANSSEYIQEVTNLKIQLHKIHKPQANP